MNNPLSSWNDNGTKQHILGYIQAVTDPSSAHFVQPAERIATFDNDGTLWLEKPLYIQLQFGLRAIGRLATERPDLRDCQPFKAVYEQDMVWLNRAATDFAKGDPRGVMSLLSAYGEAFAGITVEAFEASVQENDFQVYITTGGGRDFLRAVCEEVYNIPRSMTIGSSVTFQYVENSQGVAQMLRTKELEQPIDDGPGKPPHIHRAIGRRPIMAVGNSNGDIQMLKYATGHEGLTLGLLVHHDDHEREYAYDSGAEEALQQAAKEGWCVVSMKNDWRTVFS